MLAPGKSEQRGQQLVGVADLGDLGMTDAMEDRRGHYEDRGIDEERHRECDG